jgi:hypothetical protein
VRADLQREVHVGVKAEQSAVVDDDAAERNLVVNLASVDRDTADEIHGVGLHGVLDDALTVPGIDNLCE